MTLTAIEDYFGSNIHKPFYAVVGTAEYEELNIKLEELGIEIIKLSDCCRGQDKRPDLDLLREKLRTADVDCKSNKVAIIGLAEYLLLMGEEYSYAVLDEFKDLNLGSAWVVFLLRGEVHTLRKIAINDPRFDNRRYYISKEDPILELSLSVSPTSFSLFDLNGVKELLCELEEGKSGEIGYNSDVPFPNAACRIKEIRDSYEAIRIKDNEFDIPKCVGEECR